MKTGFKQAQEESAERYRLLMSMAHDAIAIVDGDTGIFLECNARAAAMAGVTRDWIVGRSCEEFFPLRLRKLYLSVLQGMTPGGGIVLEALLVHPQTDKTVPVESSLSCYESGGARHILCIVRDITERKEAERALHESGLRLRRLMESAYDAIFVAQAEGGRFVECNARACELSGMSHEELLSITFADLVPPDRRDLYVEAFLKVQSTGHLIEEVELINRKTGRRQRFEVSASSFEVNGKTYIQGIVRDWSERLQQAQALRESEERYRRLMEFAGEAIIVADPNTGITLDCNARACQLFGLKREKLIGMAQWALAEDGYADHARAVFQRSVRLGGGRDEGSIKYFPDGSSRWVEVSANCYTVNGRPLILGIFRDLTERRATEEALRQSEERYRVISQLTSDYVFSILLYPDGKVEFTWASDKINEIIGYSIDALNARPTLWERLRPDHAPVVERGVADLLAGKSVVCEFAFDSRQRGERWLRCYCQPQASPPGGPVRVIGATQDITDRKRAERALAESEERFRQLAENVREVFWVEDLDNAKILYVSPALQRLWGVDPSEMLEDSFAWLKHVHPDDGSMLVDMRERQIAGQHVECKYRLVKGDGSIQWVRARSFPVRNAEGRIYRTAGVAEDITDRCEAEERLREQMLRLDYIVRLAPDGFATFGGDRLLTSVNPAFAELFGYLEQELEGRNVALLAVPESRPLVHRHLLEAARHGRARSQIRIARKDGTTRDVEMTSQCAQVGEKQMIFAFFHDLTENLRLQRHLLDVSSREQQRIGQDLHDRLGQYLTGIALRCEVLVQELKDKCSGQVERALEIESMVNEAIQQTRDVSRGLAPVHLESSGLMLALADLAQYVERVFNIQCAFRCEEPVLLHDADVATQVYRIAQEAATNAVKHGRPARLSIELRVSGEEAVLTVTDDGAGISPSALHSHGGMGLHIMNHRARMIGGTLSVRPGTECGTVVACTFSVARRSMQPTPEQRG